MEAGWQENQITLIVSRPLVYFDIKLVGNCGVGIVIVGAETQARVSLDV